MLKLQQFTQIDTQKSLTSAQHHLIVLDEAADFSQNSALNLPLQAALQKKMARTDCKFADLSKSPVWVEQDGHKASFVVLKTSQTVFQQHTLLRKAAQVLLDEKPASLNLIVQTEETCRQARANAAVYVIALNAAELPSRKKKDDSKPLSQLTIFGVSTSEDYAPVLARVAGNTLCRSLTMTPPNELTPTNYRQKVAALAKENGWQHAEFDMPALKKMGAGAFYAVGQGSEPQDAAIVHLTYAPKDAKKHIALVGKGICFDTGGHNLKPAKYMYNMHEDMNGSAVALGILLAATQMNLPVKLDCWLAIAQNHIGPKAFKQNDVVTALNGMTIEIIHTDAEGRMVLADTLTLASRKDINGKSPEVILDYATLTGAMAVAVTERMSGVVANRPELCCKAVGAGAAAGERIVAFPYEEDMDADLDSEIADIKQCTAEGGGDHMHAARFMGKFIENDVPWLHADLSSTNYKGGLGAAQSTVNGFGVGFGLEMIKQLMS